jgi:hypothetical protein
MVQFHHDAGLFFYQTLALAFLSARWALVRSGRDDAAAWTHQLLKLFLTRFLPDLFLKLPVVDTANAILENVGGILSESDAISRVVN